MSDNSLTERQLYLFDTAGYLHLPQQLTSDEVATLRNLFAGKKPTITLPRTRAMRWENVVAIDERIRAIGEGPRVVERMKSVINQPLRMLESYSIRSTSAGFLFMHNGNAQDVL